MKRTLTILLAASLASAAVAGGEVASQQKSIVLMQSTDLPQVARSAGQSMELYALNNGETYLYIEQQQLGRLAILDVTDPAHIKTVGIAQMNLPEAFDFAAPIAPSAFLVNFRDGKG